MKTTLVIVDTRNLRHNLSKTYNRDRLDFTKYLSWAVGDDMILAAKAYGSPLTAESSQNFIKMLRAQGFEICFTDPIVKPGQDDVEKKDIFHIDPSVAMSIDALELCLTGKIDRVVIGSSSPQLAPLVTALRRRGIVVDILASRVTRALHHVASSVVEIPEDLLLN